VPDSMLLALAACDAFEQQGRVARARELYARLERRAPCPIVFVQAQQFERRCAGVAAARAVFRRARGSSQGCAPSVFAAAALLELRCNKDAAVARNVFELGLKRFPRDPGLVANYLDLLEALNEEADLVTLFERAVAQLDARDALPVWERYREFCARFAAGGGGLAKLRDVEKRMAAAFPDRKDCLTGLAGLVHRYAFVGAHAAMPADLALYDRARRLSLGPHAAAAHSVEGLARGAGALDGKAVLALAAHAAQGQGAAVAAAAAAPGASTTGGGPAAAALASAAKTPAAVRRLEQLLPDSLGPNVKPLDKAFYLAQIEAFKLPPKSVFAVKKKRKLDVKEEQEVVDVYSKRKAKK
jgi:hypothetical protein